MQMIKKYFPEMDPAALQKLQALESMYADWNAKINVISRKDIHNFQVRHLLHSLSIAKVISFHPQAHILDLGTGGGFPGVPLAIVFPETQFTLVDSIGKKLKIIDSIKQELGISNIQTLHSRVEEIHTFQVDFVVTRAVAPLPELLRWTKKLIKKKSQHTLPNGLLALKGGDGLIEEMAEIKTFMKTWRIEEFFEEEHFKTKKIVYVKF